MNDPLPLRQIPRHRHDALRQLQRNPLPPALVLRNEVVDLLQIAF